MMKSVESLPPAFERFKQIGGVLDFAIYEDAGGDEAEALAAIGASIPDLKTDVLKALGCRRIDKRSLYGDWYDAETASVIRFGACTTGDGHRLVNPRLRDLEGIVIREETTYPPEPGEGGQLAYAFSWTPYGLQSGLAQVQELFTAITDFVLPPDVDHHILDWNSPRLPDASDYFAAGMEWWGVFLFTIHIPAIRRLTVIAGSTTD